MPNDNIPEVNGIKCYDIDVCRETLDYPKKAMDTTLEIGGNNWWCASRIRLFTSLIKKIASEFYPSCHYLEIACADGSLIHSLMQAIPSLSPVGSEIYLHALEHAKQKNPNAEFIQLDIRSRHDTLQNKFDLIGAFDVLEHIEDDEVAINNIYCMLNNKGYLLLSVPQYPFLWSQLDEAVGHKRRYTKSDMIKKLKNSGFKISYVTSFIFALFPAMLLSRLVVDRLKPKKTDCDIKEFHQESKVMNTLFNLITKLDEILIKYRLALPFGGTLIVLAQKDET